MSVNTMNDLRVQIANLTDNNISLKARIELLEGWNKEMYKNHGVEIARLEAKVTDGLEKTIRVLALEAEIMQWESGVLKVDPPG